MTKSIALSLVFILGCVAGATTAQLVVPKARAGTNPTRWEYHCAEAAEFDQSSSRTLNARGAEGWELVSTTYRPRSMMEGDRVMMFCFKRPVG